MTLVNLSIFYLQAIPNRQKSIALATETIQIAEQFPHVPIVQQCMQKQQSKSLLPMKPVKTQVEQS